MIFADKITIGILFRALHKRESVFYCTKSVAARIAEKLLSSLHIVANIHKLDFGNVDIAPDIRKNAYETAHNYLSNLNLSDWCKDISRLLSIDFNVITMKFYFDELYTKYEFLEIAKRYAIENPSESHTLYLQTLFSEPYADILHNYFTIINKKEFKYLHAVMSMLLLPLLPIIYWYKHGTDESLHYNNEIVCSIDCEATYEMFSNLFCGFWSLRYVIENHNVREFSFERFKELDIHILRLSKTSYCWLRRKVFLYIFASLKHYKQVSQYGARVFWLFYTLVRGRAEAISGANNLFFVYEHLVTTKAARNEFLKQEGSKSVFLPKNAHASPQYFHSEIFINYDVMFSAGKQVEELYRKKNAFTAVYLPSGSYDNHRRTVNAEGHSNRTSKLKAFKSSSLTVTILSPGICDPTYSHEIKLMKLAQMLAAQDGIKVFIRLKPVPPAPKYADFYTPFIHGQKNIMLTAGEYELFDFLEVTDLFVTSISNAACDIALCGGQVMFIDYMQTPDLFLFWTAINDIVLTGDDAFIKIMAWLQDVNYGNVRKTHREKMKKLTEYIGYCYPDFESYRNNIISHLQEL